MTAVIHSKSERIDVRASAPVKQLLQEAARVAHKNVSEFLLDAGIIAANQTFRLAQSPAHHQDMCLGVQPGGVLPKDMSALQVPKRKVRLAVGFSPCS